MKDNMQNNMQNNMKEFNIEYRFYETEKEVEILFNFIGFAQKDF